MPGPPRAIPDLFPFAEGEGAPRPRRPDGPGVSPALPPALSAADAEDASALCLAPPPGRMAGIFGPGACGLALRALARPLLAGETAAVVDGGQRFDPYEVSRAARARGGDGRAALARVRVSRAFTCHQMEALLARRLPAELARSKASLAVVLGLTDTFLDEDVPFPEACRLFRSSLSALRRIAEGGVRVVLAGGSARADRLRPVLGGAAGGREGFLRRLEAIADPRLLLGGEDGDGRSGALPPGRPGGVLPAGKGRR